MSYGRPAGRLGVIRFRAAAGAVTGAVTGRLAAPGCHLPVDLVG